MSNIDVAIVLFEKDILADLIPVNEGIVEAELENKLQRNQSMSTSAFFSNHSLALVVAGLDRECLQYCHSLVPEQAENKHF